jgi:hypothetical protein
VKRAYIEAKARERQELDRRLDRQWQDLLKRQREKRSKVFKGRWRGKGEGLNALRSVLAAEQAAEKAAFKDKQKKMREEFREKFKPFPDYKHYWEESYKEALVVIQEPVTAKPRDIRGFVSKVVGDHVHYSRIETPDVVSFIDKGKQIRLYDSQDPDAVLAILQLKSQQVYGAKFWIFGNAEFKSMAVKIAVKHGYKIANWGLQKEIKAEEERLRQESVGAGGMAQGKEQERGKERKQKQKPEQGQGQRPVFSPKMKM